jgi:hypothetical protein
MVEGEKTYDSEEKYWHDVLGPSFVNTKLKNPKIFDGDVVIFKNFQLTQWVPRIPGLYWTSYGHMLRRITEREFKHSPALGLHYNPNCKGQMIHGGLGSVRLNKTDGLSLYGATTSGNINASIPIVISSNISNSLQRFTKNNPNIEVDLKGTIKRIPFTYEHLRHEHIPKLCLYVNSILNVQKYKSDFSLEATAWTIYSNPKATGEKKFGYTYASFNPIDESSIIKATDWIQNYISEYTKGKGLAITDYDEQISRFNTAVLPLKDVMQGNIDYEAINGIFNNIDFRRKNVLKDTLY